MGFLLRGIYEVALQYGIDYADPEEKLKILKMIEGALSRNEKWSEVSDEVDSLLIPQYVTDESEIKMQISKTADIMALDMLVLKFIQGIPIIGIAGGLYNPIYYKKITKYVRLKYHKQFLTEKITLKFNK